MAYCINQIIWVIVQLFTYVSWQPIPHSYCDSTRSIPSTLHVCETYHFDVFGMLPGSFTSSIQLSFLVSIFLHQMTDILLTLLILLFLDLFPEASWFTGVLQSSVSFLTFTSFSNLSVQPCDFCQPNWFPFSSFHKKGNHKAGKVEVVSYHWDCINYTVLQHRTSPAPCPLCCYTLAQLAPAPHPIPTHPLLPLSHCLSNCTSQIPSCLET